MTQSREVFNFHRIVVLVLILFSFLMSALVNDRVFEHLPHLEDEMSYLFQAKVIAGGHMVVESPTLRRAYWMPFVLDFNGTRFGKYPPGWPAQLALGVGMGQPWIINALLAGLTVALVYRLAREIFDEDTGTIAAALTAFSPMALLLNGTIMGHTSALFFTTLFMYTYWRMEKSRHPRNVLLWGASAGLALGMVIANRPNSAIGVAAPFVMWSLVRLVRLLVKNRQRFWPALKPLLALGGLAVFLSISIPVYNYLATKNPTQNLYTMVWSYDTVGFGECCGRHIHSIEKGIRHARFDLSLTAADLFGWQLNITTDLFSIMPGEITPDLQEHLRTQGNYWPLIGISWILLPFGIVVAYRKQWWAVALWFLLGLAIVIITLQLNIIVREFYPVQGTFADVSIRESRVFSWLWMGIASAWALLPLAVFQDARKRWTWLFVSLSVMMVIVHMTYWVGSQRYSTRYFYEALASVAILSALPLAWLARRFNRWVVYSLLALVLFYSLYAYSTPRIMALYRFNNMDTTVLEGIQARRDNDRPVLVIVNGTDVKWRAIGELMVYTSPYFDSDIVGAWNYDGTENLRQQLIDLYPGRQVIDMDASGDNATFRN